MEGAATATGDIALIADSDTRFGGDVTTNGAVTAGGNVDIAGNVIQLNNDVSANGGDLTITGRTSEGLLLGEFIEGPGPRPEGYWGYIDVAQGRWLEASHDVILNDAYGSGGDKEPPAGEMDLFGHGTLGIVAEGGSIQTQGPFGEGVKITVEDLSPAWLLMAQADPLNLADYSFGNQNNTDIVLYSLNGSVTAVDSSYPLPSGNGKNENAADQWGSITATAYTDITLQGHDASRDITAGALTSTAADFDTGNITVTSDNRKVLLTGDVIANQGSVAITAIDPAAIDLVGSIVSSGDITASDGITLFGEVTADAEGPQTFDAGQGTLWAKDTLSTITKTGTGGLTLSGDTLVNLDGIEDSVWVQDGFLTITDSVDVEGNLKAHGIIHLQGTTNNVAGDILSTGSGIIIDNDLDADGVGDQVFDAGTGQLIAKNEADIDKSTAGSLTLAGDAGIELGGNVTGSGMTSVDSLMFKNNVTADGTGAAQDQRFDAGLGALDADGSITKTTDGKLNIGGEEGIELGGNVETHDGDLTLEDAVTANGGDQRFDADGDGTDLIAADDIIKDTPGSLTLGAGSQPDATIYLAGDVKTSNGDLIFWDKVIANDSSSDQVFDADGVGKDLIADDDIIKTTAGNLTLGAGTQPDAQIELAGDVTTTDGDITLWDQVIANGSDNQKFDAVSGKLWATETITKTTTGNLNLGGDDAIDLDGTVDVDAGSLTIEDDFTAVADLIASENVTLEGTATLDGSVNQKIEAENGSLYAKVSVHKTGAGDLNLNAGADVTVDGDITSYGKLDVDAGDDIIFNGDLVTAVDDGEIDSDADIIATGLDSDIIMYAYEEIDIDGDIIAGRDISIICDVDEDEVDINGDVITAGRDITILVTDNYDDRIDIHSVVTAGRDITITNEYDDIYLRDDVTAGRDITLDADYDIYAYGDLTSTGAYDGSGSIETSSSDWTTYIGGDVTAPDDITFNNNTKFDGGGYPDQVDQTVEAGGTITAHGWLKKVTSGDLTLIGGSDGTVIDDAIDLDELVSTHQGNLWIIAESGDIQLGGDVTTFGEGGCDRGIPCTGWSTGGVLIYSKDGKIYTRDGVDNDTLNVLIEGNSDHWEGLGIYDPRIEEGARVAIAIWSEEDLKIGTGTEGAELRAYGRYYDDVDDRAAIDFLADPLTSIGGIVRDEGDPFDAAIYVGSNGDVDVSSPVSIMSYEPVYQPEGYEYQYEYDYECVPKGAMVIDAWNAVTFDGGVPGGMFETSLADGDVGDRLEVVSRRSEWLFQAVGLLPYVYGGGPFPDNYSYVLRGAGLDNPGITDGRAWVLEDPVDPAPLYGEAGEAVDKEEFGEGGCPALMNWLADEIGVPAEDIQVALADALALNTDIQPCEMCARLMGASKTLEDADGTQIAAMSRVVNEFVTTAAPPSPEQMTQIAAALALHVGDGTYYASAGKWIDALVAYVGIMNSEMGYSASDSAAFAQKYLTPVTETGNVALNAYVQARLAALGG
jgi:hypothetical protein